MGHIQGFGCMTRQAKNNKYTGIAMPDRMIVGRSAFASNAEG